uniref:Brain and acute leukemia, cytoplasmic n=1 Tax=Nothobranchius furzeri TaxID=105023 RepID=A0A8C6MAU4_NOTFU
MGCGGSRADAIIVPRYHESWTRETESTWLTNTDVETPVSVSNSRFISDFSCRPDYTKNAPGS